MITQTLYLPSTPLNVLVSIALATQRPTENAQLWLIDQKQTEHNPYFEALQSWQNSPFEKVLIYGAGIGQSKRQFRACLFNEFAEALAVFSPNQVAVGSDRRVEFQFIMQHLRSQQAVTGVYLDDGLYSYAGRSSVWHKDLINAVLKKMAYGRWWQEPSTVGASAWIEQAWLFAPQQAVAELQVKQMSTLPPEWFSSPPILEFSQVLAEQLAFNISVLSSMDCLLLIPHPNNIKKIPGYETRIRKQICAWLEGGLNVAVKYHPRVEEKDVLQLKDLGVKQVVPSQLAFEFCLPALKSSSQVVGDVGTALLTTRWLRPDIEAIAVLDENDAFQQSFIPLLQAMKVTVVSHSEEL